MEQHIGNVAPSTGGGTAQPSGTSARKPGPFRDATLEMAAVLKPILNLRQPYVPPELLKQHQITYRRLNFVTGEVIGPKAERYIQQIPPATITQWLEENDRWRKGGPDLEPLADDGKPWNPPFVEAYFMWLLVNSSLGLGHDDGVQMDADASQDRHRVVEEHTQWQSVRAAHSKGDMHYKSLNRTSQRGSNWVVEATLHHILHKNLLPKSEGKIMDPDKPHVGAILVDSARIRDDVLLVSEILTVLYVAFSTYRTDVWPEHHTIPVTIVTLSNRTARVVQGIVNLKKKTVEVRMTPVLNFTNGIQGKNRTKYMALLGWLIGKPVGTTKGDVDIWESIESAVGKGMSLLTKGIWE